LELEAKSKFEQWWSQLIWESEREFESPYTVDECVRRLKALDEKYHRERTSFFNIFSFHIRDLENNGDNFSFKMDIHVSKVMLKAELFGQLVYQKENATQVKMRLGYTLRSIISLILLLPILFLFSFIIGGTSTFDMLAVLGIYIFALFIQISFGYGLKPELYHEIHKELAGDKPVSITH